MKKISSVLTLSAMVVLLCAFSALAANGDGTKGDSQVPPPPEESNLLDEAITCLNFDDLTPGTYLTTYGGVAFTNTDGNLVVSAAYPGPVFTSPNAVLPANFSTPGNRTRATFSSPVSSVSVTMGDYNADPDTLYLEAYNSSNVLIDSYITTIPATLNGGVDLQVSGQNIAYVEFWGVGVNENSVYFDNLCFDEDQECDYCLEDSVGYVWCLNVIDQDSEGVYMSGTVDMGSEVREAVATYLKKNQGVSMTGGEGSGCVFNYNWKLQGSSGSGVWINVTPSAGHGMVSVWMCGTASDTEAEVGESVPGME
jgi:hypothetical protein